MNHIPVKASNKNTVKAQLFNEPQPEVDQIKAHNGILLY